MKKSFGEIKNRALAFVEQNKGEEGARKIKRGALYLGLVAGVLAIVFALMMFSAGNTAKDYYLSTDTGTYTSYEYYGGDAYTGMQQASADTARNVKAQAGIVRAGFAAILDVIPYALYGVGGILLCMGLCMIAYFANRLAAEPKQVTAAPKAEMDKPDTETTVAETEANSVLSKQKATKVEVPSGKKTCYACGHVQTSSNQSCEKCGEYLY